MLDIPFWRPPKCILYLHYYELYTYRAGQRQASKRAEGVGDTVHIFAQGEVEQGQDLTHAMNTAPIRLFKPDTVWPFCQKKFDCLRRSNSLNRSRLNYQAN